MTKNNINQQGKDKIQPRAGKLVNQSLSEGWLARPVAGKKPFLLKVFLKEVALILIILMVIIFSIVVLLIDR